MKIYRRGKHWQYEFWHEGKRIKRSATKEGATTKKEAQEVASRHLLLLTGGGTDHSLRLGDAFVLYGTERRDKPDRWGDELHRVSDFIAFAGKQRTVASITRRDVTGWMEAMEGSREPATCRRFKTSLGAFWRWLIAQGHATDSPTLGAYSPKQKPRKKPALTVEEIADALKAVKPWPALHAAYMCSFYQGLRRSEIARARIEDVDRRRRTFHVRGQKTVRAESVIPLHREFSAWLGKLGRKRGPIVARDDGEAYHPASLENLRRDAEGILKRQLPNFHLGRHSLATLILGEGGTLEDVAAILRINPRTAYEHYGWLAPTARGPALNRITLKRPG